MLLFWSLVRILRKVEYSYLVASKNAEAVDDLFRCVSVGGFACHEVKEGVKVYVTRIVRINDGQNSLEVNVALPVLSDRVTQRHKTRFELVRCQSACPVLVEVVETTAEFIQLLLGNALKWKKKRVCACSLSKLYT